ncbi:uncharacterized protein PHALS_05702 [Plasmopara halstedii]|uniref:Uncharacterized protein n=1 Tax=Plasmopara halstedii TaxID=4781 RepID=A0A0P1B276_PLAHL|nr:uncharacterized protein PHALS_05702 [Plasmopara halstedii]CEG48233.1 hypothetical protein PHALS_05702 [Plasmopara halstedii]|eukprot:XP_024584602.1 hypothetical protein PHALS_05702 [Plasmopara halstedii]
MQSDHGCTAISCPMACCPLARCSFDTQLVLVPHAMDAKYLSLKSGYAGFRLAWPLTREQRKHTM